MAANNRKLPIGIHDFEQIIHGNYLYIDKTEYLYNLVQAGIPFFLGRPGRFGKSLFLSTLKAYWEGKRELFTGLRIEELEKENPNAWQTYPVFYFDLNRENCDKSSSLEESLSAHLNEWEKAYGEKYQDQSLERRFQMLLRSAHEQSGKRCVVLVDKYDPSPLETEEDREQFEHHETVFKSFFSNLKSEGAHIQFVLITGVTKLSKLSIFGDLNHLFDISFDNVSSGICGITEEEMLENLGPEIERMAEKHTLAQDECITKLRAAYGGYHFSADGPGVYNPSSLLAALSEKKFGSYWNEAGTQAFLIHKLKERSFDVHRLSDRTLYSTELLLSDYRVDNPDPIPLLFHTGYLTIWAHNDHDIYTLGLPNNEVRYTLLQSLFLEYVQNCDSGSGQVIFTLKRHIENGDLEGIKNVFTALFASITYTTKETSFEHYFQAVIFITLTLLNQYVHCEQHTNLGRIDCVVETKDFIYIFEFKRDESAEAALNQINDMHYTDLYAADKRMLYKIGVNFDSQTRQMSGWKVEAR